MDSSLRLKRLCGLKQFRHSCTNKEREAKVMSQEGLDPQPMDRILKARITTLPRQLCDPLPEVWVTLSDGAEKMLFTYYPD